MKKPSSHKIKKIRLLLTNPEFSRIRVNRNGDVEVLSTVSPGPGWKSPWWRFLGKVDSVLFWHGPEGRAFARDFVSRDHSNL